MCAQFYLTLCNPMDCSLTGSAVHGIFQARILVVNGKSVLPFIIFYSSWSMLLLLYLKRSPNQDHLNFLLGSILNVLYFGFYTYIFDIFNIFVRSVSMLCFIFLIFSYFFFTLWQRSEDYMFMSVSGFSILFHWSMCIFFQQYYVVMITAAL